MGGSEVPDHPWPHLEFEAYLGSTGPHLKQKKQNKNKKISLPAEAVHAEAILHMYSQV